MANESQNTPTQNPNPGEGQAGTTGASPTPKELEDLRAQLAAEAAQRERLAQRLQDAESSNQILQSAIQKQAVTQQGSTTGGLNKEDQELAAGLKPVLDEYTAPIVRSVQEALASMYEQLDAANHTLGILRGNEEFVSEFLDIGIPLEDIENFRKDKAKIGQYLTRDQATQLMIGVKGIKEAPKRKKRRQQETQTEEERRSAERRETEAGPGSPEERPASKGVVSAELQKLRSGQRLTPEERAKIRSSEIGDVGL